MLDGNGVKSVFGGDTSFGNVQQSLHTHIHTDTAHTGGLLPC